MLCYIEKNNEAVKLFQDPDKLFFNAKLKQYIAFLSGTKNLRHIYVRRELGHRMPYLFYYKSLKFIWVILDPYRTFLTPIMKSLIVYSKSTSYVNLNLCS